MCICCSWPLLDSQSKAQNFNWLSEPCQPCHSLVCLSQLSWKCWTSNRAFQIVHVFWLDYHPISPHSHNSMTLQGAFGCDPRRETLLSSCPVMKAYRDGWTRYRERVSRVFRVFVGSSPKVAVTFQCAFQLWRMCDTCCCITPAILCHTSIHSNHQIDAMQGQKALTHTTAPCQGASHIWRKRKIPWWKWYAGQERDNLLQVSGEDEVLPQLMSIKEKCNRCIYRFSGSNFPCRRRIPSPPPCPCLVRTPRGWGLSTHVKRKSASLVWSSIWIWFHGLLQQSKTM